MGGAEPGFDQSAALASGFFFGRHLSGGFSVELGAASFDPLVREFTRDHTLDWDAPDDDNGITGGRETFLLHSFSLAVSWSPEFKFFINPVVVLSGGLMGATHTHYSSTDDTIHSEKKYTPQAAVSFFLRFDVFRDVWFDLGYGIQTVPDFKHDGGEVSSPLYLQSIQGRMAMRFGGTPPQEPDGEGNMVPGHDDFGGFGIGWAVSVPYAESRFFEGSTYGGFESSTFIEPFITFWLRKGLQLELHFLSGELRLGNVPSISDFPADLRLKSFALDVIWMPEYDFFIKPLVSFGLGLASSSFKVYASENPAHPSQSDYETSTTLDLEFRWALMLRFEIGRFWLDAGVRLRMLDLLGAEIWMNEPLLRVGYRF
jgi:hypothetical protein